MNIQEFLEKEGYDIDLHNKTMYGAFKTIGNFEIEINFYLKTIFVFNFPDNTRYSESFKDYTFWQEYKHMIEYVNKLLLVSIK